jgi:hypothetical protein
MLAVLALLGLCSEARVKVMQDAGGGGANEAAELNNRPIIGILSQLPMEGDDFVPKGYSYIVSSYVKASLVLAALRGNVAAGLGRVGAEDANFGRHRLDAFACAGHASFHMT